MEDPGILIGISALVGLLLFGGLMWEWRRRNVEIKHLKTDLRNAEGARVIRRTTEEVWLHGKSKALFLVYSVPLMLVGLVAASAIAGFHFADRSMLIPEPPAPPVATIDTLEHNRRMNELLHQMYRAQVAHDIMVDELECVVTRLTDAGLSEERARAACRAFVKDRRDSLANTP